VQDRLRGWVQAVHPKVTSQTPPPHTSAQTPCPPTTAGTTRCR
jgi:hypothetical protein